MHYGVLSSLRVYCIGARMHTTFRFVDSRVALLSRSRSTWPFYRRAPMELDDDAENKKDKKGMHHRPAYGGVDCRAH